MNRRLTILIAAVAAAAVITAGLWALLSRERDAALAAARTTSVLIASDRIEAGTTGSAARDLVTRVEVPESALVPGVLTDLESVAAMHANGPILPGEQVVAGRWSDSPYSPLRPPSGLVGLAVQLSDPQRVAGFLTPGSTVAVFATLPTTEGGQRTRLLMAPVTVLGVGSSTVSTRTTQEDGATSTEQVPSAVLTLAVTISQAERLVFASTEGQLHMGLLGDRVRLAPGPGITSATVFGAGA